MYEPFYRPTPEHDEPIDLLAKHIEWSNDSSIQFFSGFRGSGKTTELRRLEKKLKGQDCVVVFANALDYLNPSGRIDISDLLVSLAGAFGEAIQSPDILGSDISKDSYWTRFIHFLTKTEVDISDLNIKAGGEHAGMDVKLALKASPRFRERIQQALANHIGTLKAQVDEYFAEAVSKIREYQEADKKVVFIFDSLEQIRGAVTTEDAVIQSVESLFANHIDKLSLPGVHLIYTVPPWLKFILPGVARIEMLPGVRLWNNDQNRSRCDPGMATMRSLVQRRLSSEGKTRLFGHGPELPDLLIDASGGHLRDLLRLMGEVILRVHTLPATRDDIDRSIAAIRSQYLPISLEDAKWLDAISKTRRTDLEKLDDLKRLVRFLDAHLVLYLVNGKEWYDIHPLIREEVVSIVEGPRRDAPISDSSSMRT